MREIKIPGMGSIMHPGTKEGWKNPPGQENPKTTTVILSGDKSVVVPKGRN